jgi:hypothetical protein
MAVQEFPDDLERQHRHAVTTVLLERLQADPKAPPPSEQVANAMNFEAIPINALPQSMRKTAISEYVLWREHPDLADYDSPAFRDPLFVLAVADGHASV